MIRFLRIFEAVYSRASAHRYRGLYEIARGRTRRGVARLERSLAEAKALSTPFDEARALLELARALPGERGAKNRATAIELYERLGATYWAERARR